MQYNAILLFVLDPGLKSRGVDSDFVVNPDAADEVPLPRHCA